MNVSFSNWTKLLLGVPQGSGFGPLLFNIYINDLFCTELTNVCNYADDTTFYACDSDICHLIKRLEHDLSLATEWFESNYIKFNEDKCYFILSGYKHEIMFANIGERRIWEKGQQKLLGVTIDKNLNFKEHTLKQCKKAGKKLSVLDTVCHILNLNVESH